MPPTPIDPAALRRALALRDLTDPAQGPHAMQQLLDAVEAALAGAWHVPVRHHRAHPVVTVTDNYDRLGYGRDAVARDARYTRYTGPTMVLRSQTSAMLPPLLDGLAAEAAAGGPLDVVLSCPGLVYRRDSIDRHHVGEPHQADVWRIRVGGPPLGHADLEAMIGLVVGAALPGMRWRSVPASHPYTTGGLQIDVANGGAWVEVGECGLANPALLAASGLGPPPAGSASGLAMGLGLDRLLMLRKGIDDIRLLRATDPRVTGQMGDLAPYRPVSSMPPIRRDLSVVAAADATPEDLGERIRAALGPRAASVESAEVVAETPYGDLPPAARDRLGIRPGQKNVLIRLVLRDLDRTLTDQDANRMRDEVYAAVHDGDVHTWAADASR
jgi:phenylalanyl-tRNA synthetase alpha chain